MRRLALLSAVVVVVGVLAGPAVAVNDPFVPGDQCSASETAVGHPAAAHEQSDAASPPFSFNNPGVSTGAKAHDVEQATNAHCVNA
jgi:hypothetical protein